MRAATLFKMVKKDLSDSLTLEHRPKEREEAI